ncbi:Bem4p NDAI_0E01120 [Naumovozyma dairenensis CBS 421]|uniref:MMS19 nucleotide excision repair protein n=1 Tax=Naumovozyma dairenensis (strain ATCC 10597 / BCRC 20456 / CBS 421 / NBRC 0211 / NRRL Y-12639) TaxID=1071378 RepID=G0WB08_NAUDC|nr:hypothetical protein NDAI_0E01120 [Naumovozyma dairenensis CBS 421]CCD24928.1 hypothetical protein NDAI_0E01120 [Naumovozyma dairenensis CBS 421]
MDLETLAFDLQPLFVLEENSEDQISKEFHDKFVVLLDDLAISLREPNNRKVLYESGLLSKLINRLNSLLTRTFNAQDHNEKLWQLCSELIRCIANAIVDNDTNRALLVQDEYNQFLKEHFSNVLKLSSNAFPGDNALLSELQLRSLILIKNLFIDNFQYCELFSPYIKTPLLNLLENSANTYLNEDSPILFTTDVLVDVIDVDNNNNNNNNDITLEYMRFLAEFIEKVSKTVINIDISDTNDGTNSENDIEMTDENSIDDTSSEIIFNICQFFEKIVESETDNIDLSNYPKSVTELQTALLDALNILADKEYPNKLIVMRRIVSIIGHISANPTNTNKDQKQLYQEIILSSTKGYTLAASLIGLSNSILSRKDADKILQKITLEKFIQITKHFKDPMQFQGFLHIFKKLLSLSNAMFLQNDDLLQLTTILKIAKDQSTYFKNLSQLLYSLVQKLLTVLPSSTICQLIKEKTKYPFLDVIMNSEDLIICLTLDKILVNSNNGVPNETMELLWSRFFKFEESGISRNNNKGDAVQLPLIYQLTKTLGIYYKNLVTQKQDIDSIIPQYGSNILELLKFIIPLKNQTDNASRGVFNNGRFISGMLLKWFEERSSDMSLSPLEAEIKNVSKSFFT